MPHDLGRFVRNLFQQAGPELARLLAGAAENAPLLHADYLSIGDLLEISGYEHREPLAVLLVVLFLALEEGSLGVEASETGLRRRLADLISQDEAQLWAERILKEVQDAPNLIGMAQDDNRPVLVHESGRGRRFLYFHKYLRAEQAFHKELAARIRQAAPGRDWRPILDDVLRKQPLCSGDKPLQLDADQLRAVDLALTRNLAVISGGPGTGKTSLVLTVMRCLMRVDVAPERIALAAPTGRAAQRLGDALRQGLGQLSDRRDQALGLLQPTTLHQLLQYSPTRGVFRRHEENPIPADVVIVDEVSMVGLVLMAQLLHALKPDAKLILLGDKDQLPSVDAGAVLACLVPETGSSETVVPLRTNHRSQKQIREVAEQINAQAVDLVEKLPRWPGPVNGTQSPSAGCFLLEQTSTQPAQVRGWLQRWADEALGSTFVDRVRSWTEAPGDEPPSKTLLEQLFTHLEESRILTVLREGPWGSLDINRVLEERLRGRLDRVSRGLLFAGAPVLITINDHVRHLYNGDVGLALWSQGSLRVFFRTADGFISHAAESLPAHDLAFALTVHKSQGSEYDRVLLLLPPVGGRRLLTKEILYTGITRARKVAVICASADVLCHAVARKIVRESGFS